MKKILLAICIILFLSGLFIFFSMEAAPVLTLPAIPQKVEPTQTNNPVIEEFNNRIVHISSLQSKASFTYYDKYINVTLKGVVHLEKPQNFRIIINSFFGNKAIDIGSNNELFWFWSKWMNVLNWAYHKDYEKTRLKDPLHPMWLMDSFGLSKIDASKVKVQELGNQWMFVETVKSSSGYLLRKTGFINKATYKLDGFILSDLNGKVIASSEIKSYVGDLPKQILFNWKEENLTLMIELGNPVKNMHNDSVFFKIPDITPKEELR